jgi:hypothetical protein
MRSYAYSPFQYITGLVISHYKGCTLLELAGKFVSRETQDYVTLGNIQADISNSLYARNFCSFGYSLVVYCEQNGTVHD